VYQVGQLPRIMHMFI